MTPTLAYLLGLVTLPGMVLGLGAAFYVCDRVVGWWRGPMRRWSALARTVGHMLAREGGTMEAVWRGHVRVCELAALMGPMSIALPWPFVYRNAARRWARWAPWWPA